MILGQNNIVKKIFYTEEIVFVISKYINLRVWLTLAGCIFIPYNSQRRAVSKRLRSASAGD